MSKLFSMTNAGKEFWSDIDQLKLAWPYGDDEPDVIEVVFDEARRSWVVSQHSDGQLIEVACIPVVKAVPLGS